MGFKYALEIHAYIRSPADITVLANDINKFFKIKIFSCTPNMPPNTSMYPPEFLTRSCGHIWKNWLYNCHTIISSWEWYTPVFQDLFLDSKSVSQNTWIYRTELRQGTVTIFRKLDNLLINPSYHVCWYDGFISRFSGFAYELQMCLPNTCINLLNFWPGTVAISERLDYLLI